MLLLLFKNVEKFDTFFKCGSFSPYEKKEWGKYFSLFYKGLDEKFHKILSYGMRSALS